MRGIPSDGAFPLVSVMQAHETVKAFQMHGLAALIALANEPQGLELLKPTPALPAAVAALCIHGPTDVMISEMASEAVALLCFKPDPTQGFQILRGTPT